MSKINTQEDLLELVTRGIESVYPSKEALLEKLATGESTSWYLGIDPTGPSIHVGHSIVLKKLRDFQKLGHKIILLIGDFTAMIGDPTDKTATRKRLTREEVLENAKSYKEQASFFLKFDGDNPAEIRYNSEWLAAMSFADVVELSSHFTVQRLLERDMFDKRVKEGKPVYLHEFLYPLMQAYDSVMLDVDGEMGGNDQTYNMLAGRTLMKEIKHKNKFVITMKLLADQTGKKMGKSEGNMITLQDSAADMYGKIMSWTDGMILSGFELLTDVSTEEIQNIQKELENGLNPRDAKDRLAQEVVAFYHGQEVATEAAEGFASLFKSKEVPEEMEEIKLGQVSVIDALVLSDLAPSKGEARRLIEGGGVRIDGEVIKDGQVIVEHKKEGVVLQKGKRHFVRLFSDI